MIPPTPVHVRSFLRTKGRKGVLVPIDEWSSPLRGRHYIEGALELTIGGKPVVTQDMWDDLDFLWPMVIKGLEELTNQGSASVWFPDQPLELAFDRVQRDTLRVAAQPLRTDRASDRKPSWRNAAGVEERNFYAHMIHAGEHFFRRMEELQADGGFQQDLDRLGALRAQVLG